MVPFDHDLAVDARHTVQHAHATPQPPHLRLDLDDVPWMDGAAESHALDPHEVDQPLAVLRLRQDQDRPDLRHRLGENGRRQHRRLAVAPREIALVQRDVLDPDDALVRLEFGDAIDEQERITMRKDALDRGVVERQLQGIHELPSIIGRHSRMSHPRAPGP